MFGRRLGEGGCGAGELLVHRVQEKSGEVSGVRVLVVHRVGFRALRVVGA